MKKFALASVCAVFILVFFCGTPENPLSDHRNVQIAIFIEDTGEIFVNDTISVKMLLSLANMVDSLTIAFGDGSDSTLYAPIPSISNNETLAVNHAYRTAGPMGVFATAYAENVTRTASLILNITMKDQDNSADTSGPSIRLRSFDNDTVSCSSPERNIEVVIWDVSGVADVKADDDTSPISFYKNNDSTWSSIFRNIKPGITAITLTATDSAKSKNVSAYTFYLDYDTTLSDRDGPIIVLKSGPQNGERIAAAKGTLTVDVDDFSGVDTVFMKISETRVEPSVVSGKANSFEYDFGSNYGLNTIRIIARDRSISKNTDSLILTFDYNTLLGPVVLETPEEDQKNLSAPVNFRWSGANDPDGDDVDFILYYGNRPDSLTNSIQVDSSACSVDLKGDQKYYWKVAALSKSPYSDTSVSDVSSFRTLNTRPEIRMIAPLNGAGQVQHSDDLSFSIFDSECAGFNVFIWLSTDSGSVVNMQSEPYETHDTTVSLASLNLKPGTLYFWRIVVSDNSIEDPKFDTSETSVFWTKNQAPQWYIPELKDTSYYKIEWNLGKICKASSDGKKLHFSVANNSASIVNDSIIKFSACGQIIQLTASDSSVPGDIVSSTINFNAPTYVDSRMALVLSSGSISQIGCNKDIWTDNEEHPVTFRHGFYMDTCEVTQDFFSSISGGRNPSHFVGKNKPVETVSWYDAILWCNMRSKMHGLDTVYSYAAASFESDGMCIGISNLDINNSLNGYRLPTEAEWEATCRAGDAATFIWGEDTSGPLPSKYSWYGQNSELTTHDAGMLLHNQLRLYDLAGNVTEWVQDCYTDTYLGAPSDGTARTSCNYYGLNFKVHRGGDYFGSIEYLQSSRRMMLQPEFAGQTIGFRAVRNQENEM